MPPDDLSQIQQSVLNFAARDQGRWDDLLQQFHADGRIQVSWFRGPFARFVEASQRLAASSPVATKHLIWPPRVRVAGDRAVADTDVAIMLRMPLRGQQADLTSYARFHDWFERRETGWKALRRVCIYERDRLDPVGDPTAFGSLRDELDLHSHPAQYRHLAGTLASLGAEILPQVCAGSDEEQAIFASDQRWLDEGAISGPMAIELAGA
ncbi:nuclear transport factor 2 family protein [Phenylobacterium sp.]|uniref:nuclear transport factor 2 family protein n=1 Tax=Phenylobacterium sp. TaxID=1871053 RepID=UPI002DF6F7C2|nr:nuclear transport factor 2 family protein [Phenylobacterium sp.]